MEILLRYLIYFTSGLLVSLIGTYVIKSVAKERGVQAGISSFVSMFVSMYIILDIIANIVEVGILAIFFYALGNALGSYLVTEYKKGRA